MSTQSWLEATPLPAHAYPGSGSPRATTVPCGCRPSAAAGLGACKCARCGQRRRQAQSRALQSEVFPAAVSTLLDQQLVRARIAAGERDVNKLTNAIFWRRNPHMANKKIAPDQRALADQWLAIRRDVVLPELARAGVSGSGSPAARGAAAAARAMAARPVPGLGVTLKELVDRHRKADAPELPLELLLAFIYREAGNRTFDDATAGKWSEQTQSYSPGFYELGVFQTPAGEHGCRKVAGSKQCAVAAPGRGVDKSRFGEGFLRFAKKLPDQNSWRDPTLQVRIGLWDLASTGDRIRGAFADLFPSKQSEWYLRMAVLYSFSRGAGWTRAFLTTYRKQLLALPESQRWDFLRGKSATAKLRVGTRTALFKPENVDEKMSLAKELRGGAAASPPAATPPRPTPPAPSPPRAPLQPATTGQYDGTKPAPGTVETRRSFPTTPPVRSDPARRDAASYENVLNQFAVGHNPRYAHRNGATFCNIYVWDVTRAMGAEIPHWTDRGGNVMPHLKGNELNANAVNDWLHKHGARHGWRKVSLAEGVRAANLGQPAVASWKNTGGIGHVAMIRPTPSTEADNPWMAQAGAKNSNRIRMYTVWKKATPVELWVHA